MKPYFYIYVFLLCAFILAVSYYNTTRREPFEPNVTNIVLLGDSILKNDSYVANGGHSVEDALMKKTEGRTHCYAKDGATIGSINQQLIFVKPILNKKTTLVFLSVGGNDIIEAYVEQMTPYDKNKDGLAKIFKAYKKTVGQVREKMNNAKLVLLDIYYPTSEKYKDFHPLIEDWNNMIYAYAGKKPNGIDGVLKISDFVTDSEDFTFDYEPSGKGGAKIAQHIYEYDTK